MTQKQHTFFFPHSFNTASKMASKLDRVGVKAYSVFSALKHPKNLGLFLKSPETFQPISGAIISFISSQRRGSKPPNFAVLVVLR